MRLLRDFNEKLCEDFNIISIISVKCLFIPGVERKTGSQIDIQVCKGPNVPIEGFLSAGDAWRLRDIYQ